MRNTAETEEPESQAPAQPKPESTNGTEESQISNNGARGKGATAENDEEGQNEEPVIIIENLKDLEGVRPTLPPDLVQGLVSQNSNALITAPSKAGKTGFGAQLCLSVQYGIPFLGKFHTEQRDVVFVDPETTMEEFVNRLFDICDFLQLPRHGFRYINLLGSPLVGSANLADVLLLEIHRRKITPGLLYLDSLYRLLGKAKENDHSAVRERLDSLVAKLQAELGATILGSHHQSKGTQADKAAIDRASGAGFDRYFRRMIPLTQQEESSNHFTVNVQGGAKPALDFVVKRTPCTAFILDENADPKALAQKPKPHTGGKQSQKGEREALIKLAIEKFGPLTQKELEQKTEIPSTSIHRVLSEMIKRNNAEIYRGNELKYFRNGFDWVNGNWVKNEDK
jgi:AAA domain